MTEFERGPLLWLPKTKDIVLETRTPPSRLRGRYKLEARGLDGRIRPLTGWFENLVTTNGANLLGNGSTWLNTCAVGSGNTAPNVSNTALVSLVASTTTVQSGPTYGVAGSSPWYGSTTIQYAFGTGAAAGNLSEVGVGATATSLFSRALILDGSGNPTTITVLSSEALYVTYEIYQYSPSADVTGNITIGGVNYSYTLRAANANASAYWAPQQGDSGCFYDIQNQNVVSNGTIGSVTGSISGSTSQASAYSNSGYSAGSFSSSGTLTWGLNSGNVSGGVTAAQFVSGQTFGSRGMFQIGFGAAIPKTSSYILTLSFSTSWAINTP